ncbi:MAG TPA: biotin/lipoyl-binding protein, partial [Bacillota bacterium]|nr:biotin/lipoyl-binding protein [Bacillota bacterium]
MKKYLLAILIIGAAIISAACSKPSMDVDAESDRAPVPDKTVEAFGIVEASDIESISLDIEAVVEEVIVKEGQQVKKGD